VDGIALIIVFTLDLWNLIFINMNSYLASTREVVSDVTFMMVIFVFRFMSIARHNLLVVKHFEFA
jgi:hypothetical protein